MNSPKIRFLYFWNIGQYPLEFYKHVVKSRNARKMIFVVFKKSMRIHIFKASNICFLYIKKRKNNVRVLAVCMKTKHFFIFIFFLFSWRKPGIFIPDLYLYSTKIQTCRKSQIFLNTYLKKTFEWAIPGPKGKWAEISPTAWAYFLQGWTQPSSMDWADIPARNKQ